MYSFLFSRASSGFVVKHISIYQFSQSHLPHAMCVHVFNSVTVTGSNTSVLSTLEIDLTSVLVIDLICSLKYHTIYIGSITVSLGCFVADS